ncbi:MAG: hypothetical protein AAGG75_08915 [Bacteroidota bacterium]
MQNLSTVLLIVLFSATGFAQRLPQHNIYLFEMKQSTEGNYLFTKPRFLTGFNPTGYNNQPAFIDEDNLLITAQLPNDTTQTDIYHLNLKDQRLARFTQTMESEFSPTPMPTVNNGPLSISSVRVEADGKTQRLWEFPYNRTSNGQPVIRSLRDVGYHHWIRPKDVLLFLVGEPHNLASVNVDSEVPYNITSNIGRCFQTLPNGDIAFVHKMGRSWLIKRIDPSNFRLELITATLPDSEDFAVLPDGTFLMGNGQKLFKFHPNQDARWQEVADFSYYGIGNISRLAVKGNKLAVVVD